MARSKQEKAEYDRKRKADAIKERRFMKPLKIFMKKKYVKQYNDFVKFYNEMEKKFPSKRDLTKSEMFKNFLKDYPETSEPIEPAVPASETIEPTVPASETIEPTVPAVETIEPAVPAVETIEPAVPAVETIEPAVPAVETIEPTVPAVETIEPTVPAVETIEPTVPAVETIEPLVRNDLLPNILNDMFGPGDLDSYVEFMENADEGIDINVIDELMLELEEFDFEVETRDF